MTTYMVSYDLGKPGRDYEGLSKYLQSFGGWWHNLESTWLITTDESASDVCSGAGAYLDSSDKLLVARVSAPGAWRGFAASGSQWLKDNL